MAQQSDSANVNVKKAIVNAGWLHDWRGAATQWMNVNGIRAEVSGYVSVDKRIRFFKNGTFEIDVYREPPDYSPAILNQQFACRGRQDGEMSVNTGTWSVKGDSVYIFYRREGFYDYEQYSEYQSLRQTGESVRSPKMLHRCALRRNEIYLWRDRKLCIASYTDICFK